MPKSLQTAIIGGGLVGSLLSIYLFKRGYQVVVFERRGDPRTSKNEGDRSINLALSNRGIKALKVAGLADKISARAIPMSGRMLHDLNGGLSFLPYGRQGQFINSISRNELNKALLDEAERLGVKFFFEHRCTQVHPEGRITLEAPSTSNPIVRSFDFIIGADGAYSTVRSMLQERNHLHFSQEHIEHGYKELHLPAGANGTFQLEKGALHIWPRESFMLIALPNTDGSFTCTLFFPMAGDPSFASLETGEQATAFFDKTFPDAARLIPGLADQWKINPVSSLVTVRCHPWWKGRILLIGDSAHAIVPFFGQGMNAGFEDCRILNELLDECNDDVQEVLPRFERVRKPDADAIALLALENFVEMRDLVADPGFQLRKKIEARLNELFPQKWIPLYSMVTFQENLRYSEAYSIGQKQKAIMDEVMARPGIEKEWEKLDFAETVSRLHNY